MTLREILDIYPEWADMELVTYNIFREEYRPIDDTYFEELTNGRLSV